MKTMEGINRTFPSSTAPDSHHSHTTAAQPGPKSAKRAARRALAVGIFALERQVAHNYSNEDNGGDKQDFPKQHGTRFTPFTHHCSPAWPKISKTGSAEGSGCGNIRVRAPGSP